MQQNPTKRRSYLIAIAVVIVALGLCCNLPTMLKPQRPMFHGIYAVRGMGWWPHWIMTPPQSDSDGTVAWFDWENNIILLASDPSHAQRPDPILAVFHLTWDKRTARCQDDSGRTYAVVSPDKHDVIIQVFSGDRALEEHPLSPGTAERLWQKIGQTNSDASVIQILKGDGVVVGE